MNDLWGGRKMREKEERERYGGEWGEGSGTLSYLRPIGTWVPRLGRLGTQLPQCHIPAR